MNCTKEKIKKRYKYKYLPLWSFMLLTTAFILNACFFPSNFFSDPNIFRLYSSTDLLANKNSPLNPTFNDSPVSNTIRHSLYSLVDYETVGDLKFSNSNANIRDIKKLQDPQLESTFVDYLKLEAATELIIFKDEAAMQKYDMLSDQQKKSAYALQYQNYNYLPDTQTYTKKKEEQEEEKGYWIFRRNDPDDMRLFWNEHMNNVTALKERYYLKNQLHFQDALTQGKIYRFIIDNKVPWVDSSGQIAKINGKEQYVSGYDFARGIQAYKLSADINYNRNGYFLELSGLDFNKTAGIKNEQGVYYEVKDKSFPTNWDDDVKRKLPTVSDQAINYFLKAPYPYFLDLLSKEYFFPIPYNNPRVKNIKVGQNIKLYETTNDKGKIDLQATNFNVLYGNGALGYFTKDVWYAGAYYIEHFSATEIVFKWNRFYEQVYYAFYDKENSKLQRPKERKIPTILLRFGSGNPEVFYEYFKNNNADYVVVPESRRNEAAILFANSGLVFNKTLKISQSNFITFTPRPFILSHDGITPNSNIPPLTASFIYNWQARDNFIVRAGLSGLINHSFLANYALPSSRDFQLSAIPYGNFDRYYEAIEKDLFFGGLARSYTDYTNTQNRNKKLLSDFSIPYIYYDQTSDSVKSEMLKINQSEFVMALKRLGFSEKDKLELLTKFGEGSISTNYRNYLIELKEAIKELSDGLVVFTENLRNGLNPTSNEWYSNQSSPLGFSYWSPDYNGVGTWIEASTTLSTENGLAASETNSHSAYFTYLKDLLLNAKLVKATYDRRQNKFTANISDDPYVNNSRIQKAFSNENLKFLNSSYTNMMNKKPGVLYAETSLAFLNFLIERKVFDPNAIEKLLSTKEVLEQYFGPKGLAKPTKKEEVFLGQAFVADGMEYKLFLSNGERMFAKYLGEFSVDFLHSLYLTIVFDSDFWYVPRAEAGLKTVNFILINPRFQLRFSSVSELNIRDAYMKGDA